MGEAEGSGPPRAAFRLVWSLAWPVVLHSLLVLTLGLADLIMVRPLGLEATSAIGLVRQVTFLVEGVIVALATGVMVQVSQGLGRGDRERVRGAVRQAIYLALFLCVPIALVGYFLSRPLMTALHAGPRALEHGVLYLEVYFAGIVFLWIQLFSTAIFRGAGDTRTPLKVAVVVSVLNVVLNFVFIYGVGPVPAFEVRGAAMGTVGAWGCGALAHIGLLLRGTSREELRLIPGWGLDPSMIWRMLRVGTPSVLAGLFRNSARLVFLALVGSTVMGLSLHAAVGVAMQMRLLSVLPAVAFQVSSAALVGQAIGRNDYAEAEAVGKQSTVLLSLIMLGVVGPILVLAGPIAGFFIDDPSVADLCARVLRWFAVAQLFSALSICLQGALNGAGDTKPAMRYMLVTQWGVMLPVAYAFSAHAGWIPGGLLLAWVLAPVLSFALTLRRFCGGRWKALRV